MNFSGNSSDLETSGAFYSGGQPQRAGLRIAPPVTEPTGIFVAVEMAVLLIVTALAMVSIIVSGRDDDGRAPVEERAAPSAHHAVHDGDAFGRDRDRTRPTPADHAR